MSNRTLPEMDSIPGDRAVRSTAMLIGFALCGALWTVILRVTGVL